MAARRKPSGEKHVNRWISFSPLKSAYLDSLPVGEKSKAIDKALEASPRYREWLAARRADDGSQGQYIHMDALRKEIKKEYLECIPRLGI